MKKFFNDNFLIFSVFITGACVLIVEIVAVRVLSPYYGNTIFTTSSVITVILVALSIGYYAGGRIADKKPSLKWFFGIILVSGMMLLFFHFIGKIVLPLLGDVLSLKSGPLVSSLLLFLIPALLLGTLSPYAVKLQSMRQSHLGIGSVSGKIFFWSTLGSITGSLLAGFYLIPRFGLDNIFISTSVVLIVLGFIPLLFYGIKAGRAVTIVIILAFLLPGAISISAVENPKVIYEKDGIYEKITIFDGEKDGRPARFFQQDRSYSGGMFLDTKDPFDMVYGYSKYHSVYKAFRPKIDRALIIGGGAYTVPKALLADSPTTIVEVSEIEPSLYSLSKEYFGVTDSPNLINHDEDGRRLLADSEHKYDLIFSDVYYSLYSIPSHFTTQEFFQLSKDKLSPDGVFMANVIGSLQGEAPSLLMSEIKTFKSVFPNSYFFAVESPDEVGAQNNIFIGYNSEKIVDLNSPVLQKSKDPILKALKDQAIDTSGFDLSAHHLLTDDFAPAEFLTAKLLK